MAEAVERAGLAPGDRLVCLGDSITADPHGYVAMVRQVLALSRPDVEVINAGRPGSTAADMAAGFGREVSAHDPTWVSISIGGNDAVGRVEPAQYGASVQAMVEAATQANVRVALCTPTPFEPHFTGAPVDTVNALIAQYAAWVERVAKKRHLLLVPMYKAFELVHEGSGPDDPIRLTHDGVHPSPTGRYLMGLTFLAAFGVPLDAKAGVQSR